MRGYRQFCPIARASEILGERWTFVIVRNLLIGCGTFTEIEKGAPGIPKSVLASRLRKLEQYGIVKRSPNASGRGSTYGVTPMGMELWQVIISLGSWGTRWLEIGPDIDPGVALWALSKNVDVERMPKRRVLIRFSFTGMRKFTIWALWEKGELEICLKFPGGDEDLVVTAEPEWIGRWHLRRCTWQEAIGGRHIIVEGPRDLARSFPTWFKPDAFSFVESATDEERVANG